MSKRCLFNMDEVGYESRWVWGRQWQKCEMTEWQKGVHLLLSETLPTAVSQFSLLRSSLVSVCRLHYIVCFQYAAPVLLLAAASKVSVSVCPRFTCRPLCGKDALHFALGSLLWCLVFVFLSNPTYHCASMHVCTMCSKMCIACWEEQFSLRWI